MTSPHTATTMSAALTPVGGSVHVEVPGRYRYRPWSSAFTLTGAGLDQSVYTGSIGASDGAVAEMGEPLARYSFRHAGGDVRVVQTGAGLAAVSWTGAHHQLYYYLPTRKVDVEQVARLLRTLDITDSVDGIVVRPRRGHGLRMRRLAMFTWFEGLFAVNVYHLADHAQLLPNWRGLGVASGELWRQKDGPGTGEVLLLGTPTAVVELGPDEAASDAAGTAAAGMTVEYRGVNLKAVA